MRTNTKHIRWRHIPVIIGIPSLLALVLVLCLCCGKDTSPESMHQTEGLLYDNPDSVMNLFSELHTPQQALLYNAAHYVKNKEIDEEL